MSSRDLQAVVKTQKAFIKELLDRLENSSNKSFGDIADTFIAQKVRECVKDGYFNNLSIEQIFELAKKSIRLTDDNCKMRHKLEDIAEVLEQKDLCLECKDICCTKFSEKIKNILDK